MRATRLVITLLAFLPSLFIIKADETELTEMRLVSDSLIYMIQSNVDCDGQKKFAELTFGDRGFNAGLLFATVSVKYSFCFFNPSKYIGFITVGDCLIFVDKSGLTHMDWFDYLPNKHIFHSTEVSARDGTACWNFILFSKTDIVLQSVSKGW